MPPMQQKWIQREYPAERHMQGAKFMQIVEGTNQIQRNIIAREIFKGH